jgi:hypothetical protein
VRVISAVLAIALSVDHSGHFLPWNHSQIKAGQWVGKINQPAFINLLIMDLIEGRRSAPFIGERGFIEDTDSHIRGAQASWAAVMAGSRLKSFLFALEQVPLQCENLFSQIRVIHSQLNVRFMADAKIRDVANRYSRGVSLIGDANLESYVRRFVRNDQVRLVDDFNLKA